MSTRKLDGRGDVRAYTYRYVTLWYCMYFFLVKHFLNYYFFWRRSGSHELRGQSFRAALLQLSFVQYISFTFLIYRFHYTVDCIMKSVNSNSDQWYKEASPFIHYTLMWATFPKWINQYPSLVASLKAIKYCHTSALTENGIPLNSSETPDKGGLYLKPQESLVRH